MTIKKDRKKKEVGLVTHLAKEIIKSSILSFINGT